MHVNTHLHSHPHMQTHTAFSLHEKSNYGHKTPGRSLQAQRGNKPWMYALRLTSHKGVCLCTCM